MSVWVCVCMRVGWYQPQLQSKCNYVSCDRSQCQLESIYLFVILCIVSIMQVICAHLGAVSLVGYVLICLHMRGCHYAALRSLPSWQTSYTLSCVGESGVTLRDLKQHCAYKSVVGGSSRQGGLPGFSVQLSPLRASAHLESTNRRQRWCSEVPLRGVDC